MSILENVYQWIKFGQKKVILKKDSYQTALNREHMSCEVEELLCFERAIRFCYVSLEMMVHNRTIRHQCQNFTKWSRMNEEALERMFKESLAKDFKLDKEYQPYVLPVDDLTIESMLSLGLVVSEYRLNGYQELRRYLSLKNRILLNHLSVHVAEEIKFFKREKEMVSVEEILSSLN